MVGSGSDPGSDLYSQQEHHTAFWFSDLFHTLVLEICSEGELAWNRARSDRTGELIKRGLGRRKDPIMHSGC